MIIEAEIVLGYKQWRMNDRCDYEQKLSIYESVMYNDYWGWVCTAV